ncbi:hypothetical protein QQF64_033551 [Cirrhinus molitorella]|uniref:Uncharacterized protein n=1 Tax=Cirrhinus molitorella TaxID=172907 RepID=A0ABR3MU70_9TELE
MLKPYSRQPDTSGQKLVVLIVSPTDSPLSKEEVLSVDFLPEDGVLSSPEHLINTLCSTEPDSAVASSTFEEENDDVGFPFTELVVGG